MIKINYFLFSIAMIFVLSSCNKDIQQQIPDIPVDISININEPAYSALKNPMGSVYLPGGYNNNGILVICTGMNEYNNLTYAAYDRTCTYNITEKCPISVDSNNVVNASCKCCQSSYELITGAVAKEPATVPLKQYSVSQSNQYLYIRN